MEKGTKLVRVTEEDTRRVTDVFPPLPRSAPGHDGTDPFPVEGSRKTLELARK
jgi:hypothetical protein